MVAQARWLCHTGRPPVMKRNHSRRAGWICLPLHFSLFFSRAPHADSGLAHGSDFSQPFGLRVELRGPQKPADETRYLVLSNCEADDAVSFVTEAEVEESQIA